MAEGRKELIEENLYETFILVSQSFRNMMEDITSKVNKARVYEWTDEEEQNALFAYLGKVFNDERSICRHALTFSLAVCTHKPEVIYLDEITEALRNCATGLDSYLLMKMNMMPSQQKSLNGVDTFNKLVEESQRMVCYSIGFVTYLLVQLNQDQNPAGGKNLSKLNILQGGVEERFIPSLTQETKVQIEGSFKITNDAQLQELALKNEKDVVMDSNDILLNGIVGQEE